MKSGIETTLRKMKRKKIAEGSYLICFPIYRVRVVCNHYYHRNMCVHFWGQWGYVAGHMQCAEFVQLCLQMVEVRASGRWQHLDHLYQSLTVHDDHSPSKIMLWPLWMVRNFLPLATARTDHTWLQTNWNSFLFLSVKFIYIHISAKN